MKNKLFALVAVLAIAGCNQLQPAAPVTPKADSTSVKASVEISEAKDQVKETQASIQIIDPNAPEVTAKNENGLSTYTNQDLGISFQYPEKVTIYGISGLEEVAVNIKVRENVVVIDNGNTWNEYTAGNEKIKDLENPSTLAMIVRDIKTDADLKAMAEKLMNDGNCVYTGKSAIADKPGFFRADVTSNGKIDPETGLEGCSTGGMANFLYDPAKGKAVYWLTGGDAVLFKGDVIYDGVVYDSFKFL